MMTLSNFPANWTQKITKCRHCKGDLITQASELIWKKKVIQNQQFFFTKCRLCQQSIYFWEDLPNNQFYFVNKLHIVLLTPEIPGNVGTIIRLACAFDLTLHLIEPFGFIYSEKWLRRSSANHFHLANTHIYSSWENFYQSNSYGLFALTSSKASKIITDFNFLNYSAPIYLVFGCESKGLPSALKAQFPNHLFRIPQTSLTSSINLGHAAAIASAFVRSQYFHFDFSTS